MFCGLPSASRLPAAGQKKAPSFAWWWPGLVYLEAFLHCVLPTWYWGTGFIFLPDTTVPLHCAWDDTWAASGTLPARGVIYSDCPGVLRPCHPLPSPGLSACLYEIPAPTENRAHRHTQKVVSVRRKEGREVGAGMTHVCMKHSQWREHLWDTGVCPWDSFFQFI